MPTEEQISELVDKYLSGKPAVLSFAKEHGVSYYVVRDILVSRGVKIRSNQEAGRILGLSGKGRVESAETRAKKSAAAMGHPGWRRGVKETIEQRLRKSESRKGPNNPMWKGGKSKRVAEYGSKFSSMFKWRIRKFYDNTCFICGVKKQGLDIHHMDFDKKNHSLSNLVTLCKSCHCLTSVDFRGNHDKWKLYFLLDNNFSEYFS